MIQVVIYTKNETKLNNNLYEQDKNVIERWVFTKYNHNNR